MPQMDLKEDRHLDKIIQETDHLTKKTLLGDLRSFRESIEKNRV